MKMPNIARIESPRGAPMGRPETLPTNPNAAHNIALLGIRIYAGGYEAGGAYWGIGAPLWCAASEDGELCEYFRAESRQAAEFMIQSKYLRSSLYPREDVMRAVKDLAKIYTLDEFT